MLCVIDVSTVKRDTNYNIHACINFISRFSVGQNILNRRKTILSIPGVNFEAY